MKNQLTAEQAIRFAKYCKNYSTGKGPVTEETLKKFLLYEEYKNKPVCQTGDLFIRKRKGEKYTCTYAAVWTYRSSTKPGSRGKYFPAMLNIKTGYVRTPIKDATPHDSPKTDWDIDMFLQACRYIAGDPENRAEWQDTLHKVKRYTLADTLFRVEGLIEDEIEDALPIDFLKNGI